ncbi:MAG: hypothetical protein ACLFUB_06370 [Cyclobacteriaceae bacterium]
MLLFPLLACGQDAEEEHAIEKDKEKSASSMFGPPELKGTVGNDLLSEVSGMAASEFYPDALWIHNDSGNDPLLFLISESGTTLATFLLENIDNRDWEDMAIGPGPEAGQTYLYLADIGDNLRLHREKIIYRFPEPELSLTEGQLLEDTIRNVEAIRFVYPDGRMDAETLLLDPLSGDLLVLSKNLDGSGIYRLPQEKINTDEVVELEKVGELEVKPKNMFDLVTGGDVSADGLEVLVKSYQQVYFWKRDDDTTPLGELLQSQPDTLTYEPEPQGEAIAFDGENEGYFTLSEKRFGVVPALYFYPRLP